MSLLFKTLCIHIKFILYIKFIFYMHRQYAYKIQILYIYTYKIHIKHIQFPYTYTYFYLSTHIHIIHTSLSTHIPAYIYLYLSIYLSVERYLLWEIGSRYFRGWKFHSLPLSSWRFRKASGLIQSVSEDLRARELDGTNTSLKIGDEMLQLMQWGRKERLSFFFHLLFYAGPQLIGWCPLTLARVIYFTETTSSNVNLIQNILTAHPWIVLNLGTLWPV